MASPWLPPAAPQPWIWKAVQGDSGKVPHPETGLEIHGLRFSPPVGAGSTGRTQQVPHPILLRNNKSTWHSRETASGALGVLQICQHPHFQRIKPLCALPGGKTPAQAVQRGGRCPMPGIIQGQVRWGFEHPGLVEGLYRRVGLGGLERTLKGPFSPKPF